MKVTRTQSNNTNSVNIDYKADKKAHVAPEIIDSFVDEAGEVQHNLKNGNTISEKNYALYWDVKKTEINWKSKGDSPDSRIIK